MSPSAKDLVHLILLFERGTPDIEAIRAALVATFQARNTHTLPTTLLPPPDHWKVDSPVMAAEAGISTPEPIMAFSVLDGFWKANSLGGT
jgi:hypothetical protein